MLKNVKTTSSFFAVSLFSIILAENLIIKIMCEKKKYTKMRSTTFNRIIGDFEKYMESIDSSKITVQQMMDWLKAKTNSKKDYCPVCFMARWTLYKNYKAKLQDGSK